MFSTSYCFDEFKDDRSFLLFTSSIYERFQTENLHGHVLSNAEEFLSCSLYSFCNSLNYSFFYYLSCSSCHLQRGSIKLLDSNIIRNCPPFMFASIEFTFFKLSGDFGGLSESFVTVIYVSNYFNGNVVSYFS